MQTCRWSGRFAGAAVAAAAAAKPSAVKLPEIRKINKIRADRGSKREENVCAAVRVRPARKQKCQSGKDKYRRPPLLKLLPFLIAPNHMQGGHAKAAAEKESSQACTYAVDTCNINVACTAAKHHLFIQIDRKPPK